MAKKKERLIQQGLHWSRRLFVLILYSIFLLTGSSHAASGELSGGFKQWVQNLRSEAVTVGISEITFDIAFNGVEPIESVLKLDRNQPEFKLSFEEYLARVVSKRRIARGRILLGQNKELLSELGKKYGVQPAILVALWGIETDFGRITGDFPVIAALATLAHDGRRGEFFKREVFAALHIVENDMLPLEQMRGSWAGAIGNLQFLPSVFVRYAVDFNNNGQIDVWQEKEDIFASGAHYLQRSGWQKGVKWGVEVQLPSGFNPKKTDMSILRSGEEWQRMGVVPLKGTEIFDKDNKASIIKLGGGEGRCFLVYKNYNVLLIWNRSDYFAVGVGLFADQLEMGSFE